MRDLATGERVPLERPTVTIKIDSPQLDRFGQVLGAVVVALDANRKIPTAFTPTSLATRELRPGASFGDGGAISIDFAAVPADVERLMVVLYVVGGVGVGVTFLDFGTLHVTIGDYRYPLDLSNRGEAALILVELYRHKGGWRLAANGQGFVGGIGAVANALGVVIDVPHPDLPPHGSNPPPDFDYGRPPANHGGGGGSGSGFAVDRRHILTNAHVIDGASKVSVVSDRVTLPAEIVFSDPHNDIAMLRVTEDLEASAQFRDGLDIHLGEDIIVLGFPLQGLLGSGPQVTSGNVSSLCGMGNDTSVLQFTAPIASGNSGGPILDSAGLIIGIVHSSLNTERVRQGGGVAENVNFGAKGVTIRSFLSTSNIEPAISRDTTSRNRAEIVREARKYIYRVNCEG
jgi:Trypsin-like peptidase domain/TerD domain